PRGAAVVGQGGDPGGAGVLGAPDRFRGSRQCDAPAARLRGGSGDGPPAPPTPNPWRPVTIVRAGCDPEGRRAGGAAGGKPDAPKAIEAFPKLVIRLDHLPCRARGAEEFFKLIVLQRRHGPHLGFLRDAFEIEDGTSTVGVGGLEGFGDRCVSGTGRR